MAAHANIQVNARRILNGEILGAEPEDLGNIGICHSGRERGSLYLVVEAQGPQREDVEAMLVDTITGIFRRTTTSVTATLLTALKEANALLFEENRSSMRGQQTMAAVYCAVIRPGQDALLAYAGPMAAVMVGDGMLDRLPSGGQYKTGQAPALAAPADTPLGTRRDIEPYLFLSEFGPGDMLVMASPRLFEASDEELINALTEVGIEGLPEERDSTALALTYTTVAGQTRAAATTPRPTSAPKRSGQVASATDRVGAVGQTIAQGLIRLFAPKAQDVAGEPPETPAAVTPGDRSGPDALPAWLNKPGKSKRNVGRPSVRLPSMTGSAKWVALVALVAVLIIAAFLWQKQAQTQAREREFQTLVNQAENQRALGQASVDRSQALAYLKEADSLVTKALSLKPAAQNALALRDGILRDMDDAKGIVRLTAAQVNTLYQFTAPGAGLSRVVGDGANLYVLDKGDQKLYKFILTSQGTGVQQGGASVILRKGDQVGGIVVGDLVDIAWIPSGGIRRTSNLVVLEGGGQLVEYDPAKGLSVLPVRDANTWRKAQATGGYGGNFYVLDNLANAILRYRPQGKGYEGAPTQYLQSKVDLASAVDMAIDGDIFVLLVNGQILWFSGGKLQTFPLEGLDKPMAAPVAIFTNTGTEDIYVADPANSRIVQISKQGVMKKQFIYEDADGTLQRLRGVFVDEKKNALYVTAGTKLIQIPLAK